MSKRVVLVRHGDDPPDDRVHNWLLSNGFQPEVKRPYNGDTLGQPDETVAGTVIYGGQYNAFDAELHPFLNEEYRWIDACLKADKPMLGICQGAQMIAMHLGAEVGPKEGEPHEFGYYRIDPTEDAGDFLTESTWMTQAHFHTFGIPEGAVHLASSEMFRNQAFRYGDKVYGFQFHPEVTIEGFRRWQNWDRVNHGKPGAQSLDEQTELMYRHDRKQADWFHGFLPKLFGTNN